MLRSLRIWFILGLSLLTVWCGSGQPAVADTLPDRPAQLFSVECAGCHPRGGNIIRRGKTLKLRVLQRQKVDSVAAIAALITAGKGVMSAYSDRLSPDDIELLATYVWEQAQNNWQ
jgi:cytochrome c6